MRILQNIYLLSFGISEANGYVYDIDLCGEIAHGLWFSNCKGITKDSGKTVFKLDTEAVRMIDIRAGVEDDVLTLRGYFEVNEDLLPDDFKNAFDKHFRIVVETEDNDVEDKFVKNCKVVGYVVEVVEKMNGIVE